MYDGSTVLTMAHPSTLVLGIDFDNTIVSYDALAVRLCAERGIALPQSVHTKNQVRDELRDRGQESLWTELQGELYGRRINEALPFPGFLGSLELFLSRGGTARIISHKTLTPYAGQSYNLHDAAKGWLEHHGILKLVDPSDVHFETTKEAKLERIGDTGCHAYVDDLPEILSDSAFPPQVRRILFDPHAQHPASGLTILPSWTELGRILSHGAR